MKNLTNILMAAVPVAIGVAAGFVIYDQVKKLTDKA